mgnify:CR=1 FL=1
MKKKKEIVEELKNVKKELETSNLKCNNYLKHVGVLVTEIDEMRQNEQNYINLIKFYEKTINVLSGRLIESMNTFIDPKELENMPTGDRTNETHDTGDTQ